MVITDIFQRGDLVPILFIILSFVVAIAAVTGGLMVAVVKAWRHGGKLQSTKLDADEAQAFQELQRGFLKMEDRVEALETLIIDQSRERHTAPLER